jgi:hypothetical protein
MAQNSRTPAGSKRAEGRHDRVLVPIEVWEYNSPGLIGRRSADLGLVAEALIYYDQVSVNPGTERQLDELVRWFVSAGRFNDLLALLEDGSLHIIHYSVTAAVSHDGIYNIWNIQDQEQATGPDFMSRIAYRLRLEDILNTKRRARLFRALQPVVTELKANDFEVPVVDARAALQDPARDDLLIQAVFDEVYREYGVDAPVINCSVTSAANEQFTITANVDFNVLKEMTGGRVNFRPDLPIIGEAQSNRLLWTASEQDLDLYCGDVMGTVIGNKMETVDLQLSSHQGLVENLELQVDFPDIRAGVNSGQLDLGLVLEARKRGARFRQWLQREAERDRDALVAYHNEVAEASGLRQGVARALRLFGYVGPIAAGSVAVVAPSVETGLLTVAAGGSSPFVVGLANRVAADWRPVVFGNWLRRKARGSQVGY